MRFRASIENALTFFRVIQSIEKLQKKCLIKFTETNMQIICNDSHNEGGIQVWSQIKVDSIFTGYRIQSNANNEITMGLSAEALLAVLKSASASTGTSGAGGHGGGLGGAAYDTDEIIMRLAKKNNQAVLSFEVLGTTRTGKKVRVAHDVKVEVMKPGDVEQLKEPMCPEPDTHILLPPLQKLRTIVERLRPMSDVLALRANNSGVLQLAIRTEGVKVETEWKGCTNPQMAKDPSGSQEAQDPEAPPPDPEQIFSVLVSLRSFIKFLNSHVVSTTTIACLCQNYCAMLYVYIGDVADTGGVLTFYIPAIIDDE